MKIVSLVGARPQFIKEAILNAEVVATHAWTHVLVHSGQHYDARMSDVFFDELGIPPPQYHLGVGSGSHAEMTAAMLLGAERVLKAEAPDALLVYGDTNTTLAGALAAAKLNIPIIHVEAGIRQQPESMPEEINRVVTDRLSALLCCCSTLAAENLAREGCKAAVAVTGDIMCDLYKRMEPRIAVLEPWLPLGVSPEKFIVATIHRDFNTNRAEPLREILAGLNRLSREAALPVLLPLHPGTRKCIARFDLDGHVGALQVLPPLGYVELMALVRASACVVTDSGGLQKEAYYAGRRAVVIMPDTGWRELTDCGWNILSKPDAGEIALAGAAAMLQAQYPENMYGAGDAARNIVGFVKDRLGGKR
ncbi:non-hydrolyzing UDP-N-acetylglucosamine 2-epimerase [Desulfovibrio psychrotolerans]|uniref:UDP-N-acetyl glucosamine 2-epimerase n=1 Tax=Desulfovibrio psychrotolerans TaxID=415242 RepID=A0A7J0BZA8_9BACT|nr:UDP-N-acetylglucosamine 2-epimerase (non-hydrolyzing) [Desulfovibrio psychrotolerans]GFM38535.1 UDP-N-acetyl glucosamine 2-epimerase [Desulfovibrio psychrotolerans]